MFHGPFSGTNEVAAPSRGGGTSMWAGVPNLRHLRAFAAVVACGGITKAARQIHLSQPAITQGLAKLEERIGVSLIGFGPEGPSLSVPGRLFHERVVRALAQIEEGAHEALRGEARRPGGFASVERMITVAQFRALAAMAETRNFSLAARKLGLSQPSVHRAARDLERLIGLPLFVVTREGIDLTPAAETFARHASLAHAELQQGFAEVAETQGLDPGMLVIGALPLSHTKILPDALNALSAQAPRAFVKVISAPYDELLHLLRHGLTDFIIGALRDPVPIDDVVQEPLFDDPLAVLARAGHPLMAKGAVSVEDLRAYPWVVPGEETPTRAVFRHIVGDEAAAGSAGGIVETSSLVLLRALLEGSDRLTLLSARQTLYELQHKVLAVVPYEVPLGSRRIGLTFRRGWKPTATQSLLLDEIRKACSLD
jgi:LysR family transcriptional regulator of gallate degradation